MLILIGAFAPAGRAARAGGAIVPQGVLREKIVTYLHNFGYVSPDIAIQTGPLESSQNPAYYECNLTVNNPGKPPSTSMVSVSKSGGYLALSPMYFLGPNTSSEILSSIRVRFKLGSEWQLTDGPLTSSPIPGFFETRVTAERGGKKQSQVFYVTADKRFAVLGQLLVMRSPTAIERLIDTQNQPYSGPANAPVTIVEYADLECPTCARLQPFLENQLLPRYQGKVRLIYKDFPLPQHDWSREAAIAGQCAYRIDPPAFAAYRTSIFAHQSEINVTNVRDKLLEFGEQAGIDRLKLAGCLDSRASEPRVNADYREGEKIQINFTPTCFINGRPVIGFAPPETYYRIIDEDLQHAKRTVEARAR